MGEHCSQQCHGRWRESIGARCHVRAGERLLDAGRRPLAHRAFFKCTRPAFQEGLQNALAADPSLASQIVQGSAGMNDPTTEAIAASGYLMQAAQTLQNAGISDPTVFKRRGYYNFGPANGVQLATSSRLENSVEK